MRILLSNDDGVDAIGLKTLYEVLSQAHQVTVIAPDRNCSGASNSLTLVNPLRVKQLDNGFYSVNGTPTDCVHIGINQLMHEKPDIVISGINHGPNLGDDVIYSGTVAAATEGRYMGLPAIAASLADYDSQDFFYAATIIATILEQIESHPIPNDQILNINIPALPKDEIQGIAATRCGRRHQAETMVKSKDQHGREIYWYGPVGEIKDASAGTDFYAIARGYVSVTPISVDMTAKESINLLDSWFTEMKI